jgi:hypothetical protein
MQLKSARNVLMALVVVVSLGGCAAGWMQQAKAGDNVEEAAATGTTAVDCPQLVQVKYPFITCGMDSHGNVLMNSIGQPLDTERLPELKGFAGGDGYWGKMR